MLLYPSIRDLLDQVPSRYMLVNLVANRARKLSSEAEKEGEPLQDKAVSLAIKEVACGALKLDGLDQVNRPEPADGETEQ